MNTIYYYVVVNLLIGIYIYDFLTDLQHYEIGKKDISITNIVTFIIFYILFLATIGDYLKRNLSQEQTIDYAFITVSVQIISYHVIWLLIRYLYFIPKKETSS